MRYRLPLLNSLRAFEAAGRRGSITAAAQELQVSVAAVSRHVALLEGQFGRPLLVRRRTGVEPTEEAVRYLAAIGQCFDGIDRAGRALLAGRKDRPIRLRFYTTFTTEWLAPRLPAFHAAHPDIDLQIELSTGDVDPDADAFDLMLTVFPPRDETMEVVRLFETVTTLVGAPGLTQVASDDPGAEIARHTLLNAPRERRMWQMMLLALGARPLDASRRLDFDTLSLTYQAARGGAGLALGQLFFVIGDLRAGRLAAPFKRLLRPELPHFLVCPRVSASDPGVKAFRQWLVAEAAATMALVEEFASRQ